MKKVLLIIVSVLIVLTLSCVIFYNVPTKLYSSNKEVYRINIMDNCCGLKIDITDEEVINGFINDFKQIKVKKDGISILHAGTLFTFRMYDKDDKFIDSIVINSESKVRDNIFYYELINKELEIEYIKSFFDYNEIE